MLCTLFFLLGARSPAEVESLTQPPGGAEQGVSSEVGIETQYQIQTLQQEISELRGLIEQLNHEMAEMKRLQENRYLDIDARLQSFGTPRQTGKSATSPSKNSSSGASGSEEMMYESALALIRNRQFDRAINQLESVIKRYPDGSYGANAYYWLGEVYTAKPEPDYEKARQALAQVISFYPDHRKVADAAFKLGKVYHLMGDCDRATELLQNIVEQHKGKSVSRLAETYLREKLSCE